MADPFITEDDLGLYLRKTLTDDSLAIFAVDAASQVCREIAETGFDLVENEVIKLDGNGGNIMLLPQTPVTAVSQVIDYNGDVMDVADYVWSSDGSLMLVSLDSQWLLGNQNYTVTYSHGYEEIPSTVKLIATALAARIYDQGIVSQETIGGYVVLYGEGEGGLTRLERALLSRYRPGRP